jgi:hypothetical protein
MTPQHVESTTEYAHLAEVHQAMADTSMLLGLIVARHMDRFLPDVKIQLAHLRDLINEALDR